MHRKVIKSFAKINLFLNVVSKKNKFHRIQSLFSFIDLHDRIEISTINRKKHFIKFDGKFSKGISKKNSISTLLKILDQKGLIKKKYYIKVTKNIPQKSGMGGGSMNAASILKFFLVNIFETSNCCSLPISSASIPLIFKISTAL